MEPVRVPQPKLIKVRRSAFSRVLLSLFVLALIAGVVGAGAAMYGYAVFTAEGPLKSKAVYVVKPGMKRTVGAALQDAGVVSSASIFTAAA